MTIEKTIDSLKQTGNINIWFKHGNFDNFDRLG